jgi:hypothetical protein
MAIIWGKKRVVIKLGYVAEFCPICREAQEFEISRVGTANHIYFIPLGDAKLAGHMGRCRQCGTSILVDPAKYTAFEPTSSIEIETLIQRTFPDFYNVYAERLEIEDRLKNRKNVSIPDRHLWLMEPFKCLVIEVEQRFANARFDRESGIGCAATILLLAFLYCGSSAVDSSSLVRDIMFIGIGLVVIAGPIYTLIQIALAPNRYMQRSVIPRLAKSLSPLNPSLEEISQCIAELKARGFRIGKKLRQERLWKELQQDQVSK